MSIDYKGLRIPDTLLSQCPADIVGEIAQRVERRLEYSHKTHLTCEIPGTSDKDVTRSGHLVTAAPNGGLIIRRPGKKLAVVRDTVEPYNGLDRLKHFDSNLDGQLRSDNFWSDTTTRIDVSGNKLFSYNRDESRSTADRVCSQLSVKSGYMDVIDDMFAWCNTDRVKNRIVYNYKTEQIVFRLMTLPDYIVKVGKYFIVGFDDIMKYTFTISVVDMRGMTLMNETFPKHYNGFLQMFVTPDTDELLVVYPNSNQNYMHQYVIHTFRFGELVYV